ncbi:MAG: CrcB family protein [Actinomycetota bacterium]|nr:CrcB family protein [Actinomycetota bacterium]
MTDLPRNSMSITGRRRAAVAAGGAIGAVLRGAAGEIVVTSGFDPLWATFLINVTGSLFLGFLIARHTGHSRSSPLVIPFAGVGILGAFTTFSLFSAEVFELFRAGDLWLAVVYPLGMIGTGFATALIGIRTGGLR